MEGVGGVCDMSPLRTLLVARVCFGFDDATVRGTADVRSLGVSGLKPRTRARPENLVFVRLAASPWLIDETSHCRVAIRRSLSGRWELERRGTPTGHQRRRGGQRSGKRLSRWGAAGREKRNLGSKQAPGGGRQLRVRPADLVHEQDSVPAEPHRGPHVSNSQGREGAGEFLGAPLL